MVVRTWRKISAPGRLGHQGKHSPNNVLLPPSPSKTKACSNPNSPEKSGLNKGTAPPSRKPVTREFFKSKQDEERRQSCSVSRDCTPGEIAINCLLIEFSYCAHRKIERALRTVILFQS